MRLYGDLRNEDFYKSPFRKFDPKTILPLPYIGKRTKNNENG